MFTECEAFHMVCGLFWNPSKSLHTNHHNLTSPAQKPAPQPLLCAVSSPGSRLRKAALKRLAPAPLKLWLKLRESFNRLLLVPAVGREGRSPPQWMQQQQFVVNQSNDEKSESQGSLQPAGAAWYRETFHDFIIAPFAVTILAMQQKGDDHQTVLIQEDMMSLQPQDMMSLQLISCRRSFSVCFGSVWCLCVKLCHWSIIASIFAQHTCERSPLTDIRAIGSLTDSWDQVTETRFTKWPWRPEISLKLQLGLADYLPCVSVNKPRFSLLFCQENPSWCNCGTSCLLRWGDLSHKHLEPLDLISMKFGGRGNVSCPCVTVLSSTWTSHSWWGKTHFKQGFGVFWKCVEKISPSDRWQRAAPSQVLLDVSSCSFPASPSAAHRVCLTLGVFLNTSCPGRNILTSLWCFFSPYESEYLDSDCNQFLLWCKRSEGGWGVFVWLSDSADVNSSFSTVQSASHWLTLL